MSVTSVTPVTGMTCSPAVGERPRTLVMRSGLLPGAVLRAAGLRAAGYWLLAAGCWLLAAGCWLLACRRTACRQPIGFAVALPVAAASGTTRWRGPLHPLHDRYRYDPMEGDEFDSNEQMNRRTEFIETQSFDNIHCRCAGDPESPLLLYLHGPPMVEEGAGPSEAPDIKGGKPKTPKAPKSERGGKSGKEAKLPRPVRVADSRSWNTTMSAVASQLDGLERVVEEKRKKERVALVTAAVVFQPTGAVS